MWESLIAGLRKSERVEREIETERDIESVWESLIARLRKSERVEREIERVVVGMWVSWVSEN